MDIKGFNNSNYYNFNYSQNYYRKQYQKYLKEINSIEHFNSTAPPKKLSQIKNIEPQRLINLIGNQKVAIINALSENELISGSKINLINSFGSSFLNRKNINNFEVIIVYCANYTCSAAKKYIKKLKSKFIDFNGTFLEYHGGIYEWTLLALSYNEFNMVNKSTKRFLSESQLIELNKSFKHWIKKTNNKMVDETKPSGLFTPIKRNNLKLLDGKVCVVTGGTSGLGLEAVKMMLDHGARHVTGTYFNDDQRAKRIRKELNQKYGKERVLILKADARTIEGNKKTFHQDFRVKNKDIPEECVAIDCVDINAGIFGPASYNNKHIHQIDMKKYDDVMELNLRGYVLGVQEFTRQAIHHKIRNAAIVCIKSIYGSGGSRFSNPAYQISKHGTMGLVRQTAIEFARASKRLGIPHPIRINAVSPTFTTTALTEEMLSYNDVKSTIENSNPSGQLAKKESVANTVVWLLSDMAKDITGSDFPVDCGVLSEVVPTVSEVNNLNFNKNIEFLSCCGSTND